MIKKIVIALFMLQSIAIKVQSNENEKKDSMLNIAKVLATEYIPNENLVYNRGKFNSKTSQNDVIELLKPIKEKCIAYDEDEKFEYDCYSIGNQGTKILNSAANIEIIKDTLITFDRYPKLRVGLPLKGMREYFPLNYDYLLSVYKDWTNDRKKKNPNQMYIIGCESSIGDYPNHMTLLSLMIEFDLISMNITGFEFIDGYE